MRTGEFILLFSPLFLFFEYIKIFPDKNGFKNHKLQPKKYLEKNLWLHWNTYIQKESLKNEQLLCTHQVSKSEKDRKCKILVRLRRK